jgi:hypothetical protein
MDKSNALAFERANISICTIETQTTPAASDWPDRSERRTVKTK